MADILQIPAGFITRIEGEMLEVFVANETAKHPVKVGDSMALENSGVYCEEVLKKNELLIVPNALEDEKWKNCPDVEIGLISYMGLPIRLPNDELFGTICVLDFKENAYTKQYESLLIRFRDVIENDLKLIAMTTALQEEISIRKQTEEKLKALASTDMLTGVYNRRALFERAQAEIARSKRYNTKLAVMMLDLDDFKVINDSFGHHIGDEVLCCFCEEVKVLIRQSDIFGRVGGEEFMLLLPQTSAKQASILAKRILQTIEALTLEKEGKKIRFSVSIGISLFQESEVEIHESFKRADSALYKAKKGGKNRFCLI